MAALGTVYLVGAGPGDPELITVGGLKLLRRAEVVIHDALISPELLGEVPSGCEIIDAGKRAGRPSCSQDQINAWIVDYARRGKTVVRLKGGDPFVFGRGGEELMACRNAGIECVVVPGVSSALAAPAAAAIPITHRGVSRCFAVVTAQTAEQAMAAVSEGKRAWPALPDYKALVPIDTVIVMMGRSNLAEVAQGLIDAGRSPSTPTACVERATSAEQRVALATLETIAAAADRMGLGSPVVTIIGDTVLHADPEFAQGGSVKGSMKLAQ